MDIAQILSVCSQESPKYNLPEIVTCADTLWCHLHRPAADGKR